MINLEQVLWTVCVGLGSAVVFFLTRLISRIEQISLQMEGKHEQVKSLISQVESLISKIEHTDSCVDDLKVNFASMRGFLLREFKQQKGSDTGHEGWPS